MEVEQEERLQIFQDVLDLFGEDQELDPAQEDFWASVGEMYAKYADEEDVTALKTINMQGYPAGCPDLSGLSACCRFFGHQHPEMAPHELCTLICDELERVVQRLKTRTADYVFEHEMGDGVLAYNIHVRFSARDDYGLYEYGFYFRFDCHGAEDHGSYLSWPEGQS